MPPEPSSEVKFEIGHVLAGETISIVRLKVDPVWDPIRNDPGFQQLLASKELVGPNE